MHSAPIDPTPVPDWQQSVCELQLEPGARHEGEGLVHTLFWQTSPASQQAPLQVTFEQVDGDPASLPSGGGDASGFPGAGPGFERPHFSSTQDCPSGQSKLLLHALSPVAAGEPLQAAIRTAPVIIEVNLWFTADLLSGCARWAHLSRGKRGVDGPPRTPSPPGGVELCPFRFVTPAANFF
jgi:hypothetical protein